MRPLDAHSGNSPAVSTNGSTPLAEADTADLRRKLDSLPTIEQAKGMLMGLYGCDAETAFALLRRWSTVRNEKLRLLCADLVAAASRPHPQPYGALQDFLRLNELRPTSPRG